MTNELVLSLCGVKMAYASHKMAYASHALIKYGKWSNVYTVSYSERRDCSCALL
jgi:hypothetical protein